MPYVTSHGTNIYYEVYGDSPDTLILAHGMGGNAAVWFNQVAHFLDRYRVIAFDHRYFGRSPCEPDDFKPALFPDDVSAIMDAESISNAVFFCQSMGGWTGSQLAVHQPEKVKALIMSHTPGIFFNRNVVNEQPVGSIVTGMGQSFGTPALAADYPEKNLAGAALYQMLSNFNNVDRSVIPQKIGEAQIGVDTDTLQDYQVPTLFITADKDVLFPASYIEALAATVPGASFTNLGDAGHSSYFETPEAFNAAVDDFLGGAK